MTANLELEGLEFIGLNGGPRHANFTEAVSLWVDCKTQWKWTGCGQNLPKAAARANAAG